MKNRGIWLVMAAIVAIGAVITVSNSLFIKKQQDVSTAAAYDAVMEKTSAGTDAGIQETGAAGGQTDPEAMESVAAAETSAEVLSPLETTTAKEETGLLEAAPAPAAAAGSRITSLEAAKVDYRSRLDEVDLQIQRIRSEETESNTYSMKTAAENELKLWDNELNTIYNDILTYLDEEQTQTLISEEREWMKQRDAKAVEAAKKSAGGTLEGLEYTASLAESTRLRAYELADLYEQVAE